MGFPVFLIIIIGAMIFKTYVNRSIKKSAPYQDFFERERQANLTPRKNVDDLPYIKVDPGALPLDIPTESPEIKERQDTIRLMAEKKILNFTGKSNTDLKLEYGAPNLSFLSNCDLNYTRLVQNLAYLAEDYLAMGHEKEAQALLEYGIEIGTDVTKNYKLLAELYQKHGEPSRIEHLIEVAERLNSLTKAGILNTLRQEAAPYFDQTPFDISH